MVGELGGQMSEFQPPVGRRGSVPEGAPDATEAAATRKDVRDDASFGHGGTGAVEVRF
jgi:hypothetical protein